MSSSINDQASQAEIQELKRKIEQIKTENMNLEKESDDTLTRQAKLIDRLKEENRDYCKQMVSNNKSQKQMTDAKQMISDNQIETRNLKSKIEKEIALHQELDEQTQHIKKKLIQIQIKRKVNQIQSTPESAQTSANDLQVQKQIKLIEKRLEIANKKFNATLAENKVMRNEINDLRKQKIVFDTVYQKLEKGLQIKKLNIQNTTQIIEKAQIQRDQAEEEIADLIINNEKENLQFQNEIDAINIVIDNQIQSKVKQNYNENKLNDSDRSHNKDQDSKLRNLTRQKFNSFEEAFMKIMQVTGNENLKEIVNNFIKGEDKKFSLFKLTNELNEEIKNFEIQIFEIQSEIDRNLEQGGQQSMKRKEVKELELKLSKFNDEIAQMENLSQQDADKINKIKEFIFQLQSIIQDDDDFQQLPIQNSKDITDANILQCMGIIEDKINLLLQAYNIIVQKKPELKTQFLIQSEDIKEEKNEMNEISNKTKPIFYQSMSKMNGIGGISLFNGNKEESDDEENEQKIDFNQIEHKDDDDDDDDDADLFSVPMDSQAFMAKIAQKQNLSTIK